MLTEIAAVRSKNEFLEVPLSLLIFLFRQERTSD
jgi:hypothetical protein